MRLIAGPILVRAGFNIQSIDEIDERNRVSYSSHSQIWRTIWQETNMETITAKSITHHYVSMSLAKTKNVLVYEE